MADEDEDDISESSEGYDREAMLEEVRTILRQSPRIKNREAAEAAAMPIEKMIMGRPRTKRVGEDQHDCNSLNQVVYRWMRMRRWILSKYRLETKSHV